MRKIWNARNIVLGVLLCIVAVYNMAWTIKEGNLTYLIISGITIAVAVFVFINKRNKSFGILLCFLAGLNILNGILSFVSYSTYYYLDAGDVWIRLFIELLYDVIVAIILIVAAMLVITKRKSPESKAIITAAIFAPAFLPIISMISGIVGSQTLGSYALFLSVFTVIYRMIFSIALILLMFYVEPDFNLRFEGEKTSFFAEKIAPFGCCGVPVALMFYILNSWIFQIVYYITKSSSLVIFLVTFIFIVCVVMELAGLGAFPFLMMKLRGTVNNPSSNGLEDDSLENE